MMLRWTLRIAGLLLALALLLALGAWWALRGSLPRLDGDAPLPGLSQAAIVSRDALGVATIDAVDEADAMRALGYVHAQERWFEMDLMRRSPAGELAALFGPAALDVDRGRRVHRMRARARAEVEAAPAADRVLLQAYADGANAGLAALRTRPWPYLLLRTVPEPWRPEDSILVGHAMYFDLQDATNARELALWKARPHLPEALYALVAHAGSSWDAPLVGRAVGDAVLPGPDAVDLRTLPAPDAALPPDRLAGTTEMDPPAIGSNNFAVAGTLTAHGGALVADDMHLGLRAPGIWFRARLRYADPGAPDGRVDVSGATLPGLPAVIVGSNGHVAWGFTNSYGDYLDWALETPCEAGDGTDAAARDAEGDAGCAPLVRHQERIDVAGAAPELLEVEETAWGPMLHRTGDGQVLTLRWTAHLPGAINLGLAGMARMADVEHALLLARHIALPNQNLVIGDRGGRIAWRLLGPLPKRGAGCDGRAPVDLAATGCKPWPIDTGHGPTIASPTSDRIWTANTRVVDGAALATIGDGGYALGARGAQIRDALQAADRFDEAGLLSIQLDDRALFLARWHGLLAERARARDTPGLQALAAASVDWDGHASTGSTGYRLVRAWRNAVQARIADGLLAPARAALGDAFDPPPLAQLEGVTWPLVTERPSHLLPRRYADWDALFEDAAISVRDELAPLGPLAERHWGEANTARICHPLAQVLPGAFRRGLCMPGDPLPGDSHMPRVQSPAMGASQRMVVAPGREADGIFHQPGGQSGHPLSPFWGAGHEDWVQGRPSPFLPGERVHGLVLQPQR